MYAILDTCVLVSGLRSSGGASHKVLHCILSGKIRLALSVAVAIEYEDVALRPGLISSLSPSEIIKVIDGLCKLARHQQIFYGWRPFLPDADDDMLLELAFAANTPFIITLNIKDFRGSESLGIRAITPAQALTMI